MAIAILDSNIPAENMPVLLRKQQIWLRKIEIGKGEGYVWNMKGLWKTYIRIGEKVEKSL
jgi:hypothetical protein